MGRVIVSQTTKTTEAAAAATAVVEVTNIKPLRIKCEKSICRIQTKKKNRTSIALSDGMTHDTRRCIILMCAYAFTGFFFREEKNDGLYVFTLGNLFKIENDCLNGFEKELQTIVKYRCSSFDSGDSSVRRNFLILKHDHTNIDQILHD